MKKLALAFAVVAVALLGGTAADAGNLVKPEGTKVGASKATDFGSRNRSSRHSHGYYRSYDAPRRAYYAPHAYYAQPYYGGYGYGGGYAGGYGHAYGHGGPSISLGFGGGHGGGYGGGHGFGGGGHRW